MASFGSFKKNHGFNSPKTTKTEPKKKGLGVNFSFGPPCLNLDHPKPKQITPPKKNKKERRSWIVNKNLCSSLSLVDLRKPNKLDKPLKNRHFSKPQDPKLAQKVGCRNLEKSCLFVSKVGFSASDFFLLCCVLMDTKNIQRP